VTGWQVFAPFTVLLAMIVMTVIGIVAIIVWGVLRARRKTTDARLMMRLWPLCATAGFVVLLIMLVSVGAFLRQAGTVSPYSVSIFVLSLAYPALALLGAVELLRPATRSHRNLPFGFAVAFVLAHLLIAGYLGWYGVIGFRTWS
jgi:hypothetical protein